MKIERCKKHKIPMKIVSIEGSLILDGRQVVTWECFKCAKKKKK